MQIHRSASLRVVVVAMLLLVGWPRSVSAQVMRGEVVDQTGLPLPGVTLELLEGSNVTTTIFSEADGTFAIPDTVRGTHVVARLEGFESTTVLRPEVSRIVLLIARASTTTVVVGSTLSPESPVAPLLGNTLTATQIARLPNQRMQARESLPLLPSVIRGPDGLMRLSGARPSESPMLLDGFDVTDPATGVTSISLAYEAVQGVEVLRDPMTTTYGSLMGALFKMETRAGDEKQMGLQGFVPRPRFQSPGFGRIEGAFPRFYFGGRSRSARFRYFTAVEYNFERITVPDVTRGSGPNTVEKSGSVFGRFDIDASPQHHLTIHALIFPSATDLQGLSVRRTELASPDIRATDMFAGVTSRRAFGNSTLLTIRAGALSHDSSIHQNGVGPARVSAAGWRDNWFARVTRTAVRYSAAVALEKTIATRHGTHEVTASTGLRARRLTGSVTEDPVVVDNERGETVRTVHFGPSSSLAASDWPYDAAVRDLWRLNGRLQVDGGMRIDGINRYGSLPSARGGVRYALDEGGVTVIKAGVGNFVGKIPLAVPAFSRYPVRVESVLDEASGGIRTTSVFRPAVERLRLPNAFAATVQLERQIRHGLDAQIGYTRRRSTRLATLDVPDEGGALAVRSDGRSTYDELQVSARQVWASNQQVFVSYVRSSARGELNDFMTLFTGFDQPLLQRGGMSRMSADARHRWLAWGTVNAPLGFVISPVMEWHSGFPYSRLDSRYFYFGEPNQASFPAFMAVDMIAYKTVTFRTRAADVGIQVFNLTNHQNPRDVYPVVGASRAGTFTNSVGPIFRGFMTIKW